MKIRPWLFLMIFLTFLLVMGCAHAEDKDPITQELLETIDMGEMEGIVQQLNAEMGQYMPRIAFKELVTGIVNHGLQLDFKEMLDGIWRCFFQEFITNTNLLAKLIILAVLCAILQNLQTSFESSTVGNLAHGVCYLILFVIAINTFMIASNTGRAAINDMVGFMQALLPMLITLLAAVGGVTSVALFQPLMLLVISLVSTLVGNIVLPLIFFAVVLEMIGLLSERFKVSRLVGLIKGTGVMLLGLFLCFFLGVMVVHNVAGPIADGVSLRAAKYLTGTFVPVVGSMFSDAVEIVAGCGLLLKSALGVAGVVIIVLLSLFPIIKIFVLVAIYKVAAALVQPMGDDRICDIINSLGNSLILVMVSVATVTLMFFLAVTMIVGAGDMTMMLR